MNKAKETVTVEFGGFDLIVTGTGYPEVPAKGMFGPPEDAQPGESAWFEVEKVELLIAPNTSLDITQMIEDLGGNDALEFAADEAWEKESLNDRE